MSLRVALVKAPKGYWLEDERGTVLESLSRWEAAELLFQMKDELRKDAVSRSCVDDVHRQRNGKPIQL